MNNENVYKGDIVAEPGKVYDYTEITGNISAPSIERGAFPRLTSNGGYISAPSIERGAFPRLTSNGGDISAPSIERGAFPRLTSNGGYISAHSGKIERGAFPRLTSNGGYISAHSGKIERGAFPRLTSNGGDISAHSGKIERGAFPRLTSNGGYISAHSGKIERGAFPRLTSNGGYISAHSGKIERGAFPRLTSNGGYIYAHSGKIERGAFPRLTSNGGYISAHSGDWSKVKVNDESVRGIGVEIKQRCRSMLLAAFASAGFSFADGILARIASKRGQVSRVIVCGKTEISYVVCDDEGNNAHGDTLAEARADLMVKRTSLDLTHFKAWTLDKEVSKADAILAYRSITGACAKGTRIWLEQRQTPENITVKGIIEITKGAYGSEKFEKFFSTSEVKS